MQVIGRTCRYKCGGSSDNESIVIPDGMGLGGVLFGGSRCMESAHRDGGTPPKKRGLVPVADECLEVGEVAGVGHTNPNDGVGV